MGLLHPHLAPLLLPILLLLPHPALPLDVAALLSPFPDLSAFAALLSSAPLASDLSLRSSLTVLAVPNPALLRPTSPTLGDPSNPSPYLADLVRYHVLLRFLSPADLAQIPPEGTLVATLFQATGRAAGELGAVNLTRDPSTGTVTARSSSASSTATVLRLVRALPYNLSVYAVDSLLVPSGLDPAASESHSPSPPALNITQVLLDGRDFNVAASMLLASGVVEEFEADERGAGITIFVPTDEAFSEIPRSGGRRLQSLPADGKAVVLRFHVLHSYYPLGSLESIVNPVQPTLATEGTGAGRFTLNITRVNGSVAIGTGIVQASITRTVIDQNPLAVFAVSRVLLPREIFGKRALSGGGGVAISPPPADVPSDGYAGEGQPDAEQSPTRLSSPPGIVGEVGSMGSLGKGGVFDGPFFSSCCLWVLYVLLL